MRICKAIAVLLWVVLFVGCASGGVVEHDGTELTPDQLESIYQSRVEENPDPELTVKGTVYFSASGTKYHLDPECTYLKRASQVYSGTVAEAANHGADSPCSRCGGG